MKRKNLILLTTEFPFGGGEPYLEAEIPALAAEFAKITILTLSQSQAKLRETPGNVTVVPLGISGTKERASLPVKAYGTYAREIWYALRFYRVVPLRAFYRQCAGFWTEASQIAEKIARILEEEKIFPSSCVVYAYWFTPLALAAVMVKERFPELKAVSRGHGWDVYFERFGLHYLPFRPRMLDGLDRFYCVSGHGSAYLDKKTGYRHSKSIETRYLGVKPARWGNAGSLAEDGVFRLVSCARVISLKRVNLLAEALSSISEIQELPLIEWTHLGGGDGAFENLERQVEIFSRPGSRVRINLLGDVSNEEVISYYESHPVDLFVSTSKWEGLPVSMMEAAAFGIPMLGTCVGGVQEIIHHGRNGRLLDANPGSEDIASEIQFFVAQSSGQRLAMRNASFQIWRAQFNAETNYKDFALELSEQSGSLSK